jgi:hypothetical protein
MLCLGVSATTLAVVYSTLQSLPPTQAAHLPISASSISWVIAAIPIIVSALLAITIRLEQGAKWVLLRGAAEAIKREIYFYRARGGAYRANARRAPDVALADELKSISHALMTTAVRGDALEEYVGPLPPQSAVDPNDDGFSALAPEHYIAWRLINQLVWYRRKAHALCRRARWLQIFVIGLGIVGGLLALSGLQIWVAVSSTVAAAVLSYLEFRRVETTLVAYNRAAVTLDNIQIWWVALSADEKRMPENFESLVQSTEMVLKAEQAGWTQEMREALAALRAEESKNDKNSAPESEAAGRS